VATAVATLIAAPVSGCGGGPSSPSDDPTFTVTHTPAAGATVANGTPWNIRVDDRGGKGYFATTLAFVRDDGVYSRPFLCGEAGGSGQGGGLGFGITHDVRNSTDVLNFAIGRRVNLVVLASSRAACSVAIGGPAVDPSQADRGRTDFSLNWLVGD